MNLSEKIILLTGASTGIGNALIHELFKHGAKVALVARRIELIEKTVTENNYPWEKYLILKCDVSKKEEVASAYEKVKVRFGKIDIAILNAGVSARMPIEKYNSELAERTFGANVLGVVYWIEQLLPDFIQRSNGMIVGVSSLADNRGYSGSSFYSGSKAALSKLLEGLRVELNPYNIKVLTVKPGFVKSPMTDKNEFYMPFLQPVDKAAKIIVRGIQKEKRLIHFPLRMVALTRLIGLLPDRIYEYFAVKTQAKMKKLYSDRDRK
ncbi:MAG: SDR family NAD(P)-dependent oxidoreductase [bacterium]